MSSKKLKKEVKKLKRKLKKAKNKVKMLKLNNELLADELNSVKISAESMVSESDTGNIAIGEIGEDDIID